MKTHDFERVAVEENIRNGLRWIELLWTTELSGDMTLFVKVDLNQRFNLGFWSYIDGVFVVLCFGS